MIDFIHVMGCVSSKECNPPSTGWCFHLPSLKTCTSSSNRQTHYNDVDADIESTHIVSLTSSTYGLLNTERSPVQGSFLSFHGKANKYQAAGGYNSIIISQGLNAKHLAACALMQPSKDANADDSLLLSTKGNSHAMETINTWELMDGLEEECRTTSFSSQGYGKLRKFRKPRSLDFTPMHASNGFHASCELSTGPHAGDLLPSVSGSPMWKKYYTQAEMVKESSHVSYGSPQHAPSSPFDGSLCCAQLTDSLRKPPSCSSLIELEDSRSTSSGDPLARSTSGLKILLSPVNSQSYYASRLAKKARFRVASLSFDSNTLQERSRNQFYGGTPGSTLKRWSRQQSMESSKGSDTQLFDPSLIATFEQALEATSECQKDDWLQQSMDENTTTSSSSDNTWPLSEMASDAESVPHWAKQDKVLEKNASPPLHSYERRCPPQGIDKVVFYYTSLRGVRKTFEDCCTVRLILKGLGVHVEERDVWMHSQYKEELRDVLGDDLLKGVALVPRLFIKGRYIGGVEEVKRLHEDAKLARLMDGIATDESHSVCDGCGDVRFVPCLSCNGSCKVRNQYNEVLRCPACNENGLIMCPICTV